MKRNVILLDRDGTLNVERHYLSHPDQLELLPGVVSGLQCLRDLDFHFVVLTNQSGIARGYFTQETLDEIHARLRHLLAQAGISLSGIYTCPHGPNDRCLCRKPAPGLALAAAHDLGFDPTESFVIGDKLADVQLGLIIGARAILVRTGYGEQTLAEGQVPAHHVAADLVDAANWIRDNSLRK